MLTIKLFLISYVYNGNGMSELIFTLSFFQASFQEVTRKLEANIQIHMSTELELASQQGQLPE